jgi:hypothetical protein
MLCFTDPLDRPTRVVIAGVSGVGKSTLARRISDALYLPYTEIDGLYHGAGWVPRPEFLVDVELFTREPAWITEWQYRDARPLLSARADTLVWLDLPSPVAVTRVVRRTISRSRKRLELWNGNTEPGIWHALMNREGSSAGHSHTSGRIAARCRSPLGSIRTCRSCVCAASARSRHGSPGPSRCPESAQGAGQDADQAEGASIAPPKRRVRWA